MHQSLTTAKITTIFKQFKSMSEEKVVRRKPKKRALTFERKSTPKQAKPLKLNPAPKAEKPAVPKPPAKKKKARKPPQKKEKKPSHFELFRASLKPDAERWAMWNKVLTEHSKAWREGLPLSIDSRVGILKILEANITDPAYTHYYKREIYCVKPILANHFNSEAYLRKIIAGGQRYDLDGNPDGEITEYQQEQARLILEEKLAEKSEA